MPRYRDWDDDYYSGYDDYDYYDDGRYDQCQCYEYDGENGEVVYSNLCAFCIRYDARAAAADAEAEAAEAQAAQAAKEERLRATGFYTEITTLRRLIYSIETLAGPELLEARIQAFGELFTTLLGYERFLAAKPKFREAVATKLAEIRADPRSQPLTEQMDQLDALLARLPAA
jgi:hypothetical protein